MILNLPENSNSCLSTERRRLRGIIAKTKMRVRVERILDRLDAVSKPEDMNIPGYRFHPLTGARKGAYAVVAGNRRITFRFSGENAIDVNWEDYS